MRHYCTYFDWNYFDRGLALIESMQAHCQPYHLWALALCDRAERGLRELALPDVTPVSLGAFLTDELRAVQRVRPRHEWIWTLTPFWMRWVLDNTEVPYLSYVDADCYFYADGRALCRELFDAEVAITPHRFSPDRAWMAASSGLYNVGLVFVRRGQRGLTCLDEWGALCLASCRQSQGADQGYWDELIVKYQGHAIEHKGVDLAPWNQAGQYAYSLRDGHPYVVDEPLVMYHFHKRLEPGFDLDPFMKVYVYPLYAEALARAGERIQELC